MVPQSTSPSLTHLTLRYWACKRGWAWTLVAGDLWKRSAVRIHFPVATSHLFSQMTVQAAWIMHGTAVSLYYSHCSTYVYVSNTLLDEEDRKMRIAGCAIRDYSSWERWPCKPIISARCDKNYDKDKKPWPPHQCRVRLSGYCEHNSCASLPIGFLLSYHKTMAPHPRATKAQCAVSHLQIPFHPVSLSSSQVT